jgi:hypothetical protein
MRAMTSKLVVGMLASLTAMGMTGGAAFAGSASGTEGYSSHDNVVTEQPISEARDKAVYAAQDRQRQAGNMMKHPESVAGKVLSRVSYARAAASNVVREAQR